MNATRDELELTQFSAWYPLFKHLSIKSLVLCPPPEFSVFLKSDGLLLPASVETDAQENLSEDSDLKEAVDDEELERPAGFPELEAEITSAIQSLDGFVFVKSNWSAPLDASWMKAGNIRCRTVRDVYLLLKSSDRIMFDLEQSFEKCEVTTPVPLQIVIRKWANLNPCMEFRAFIYGGTLRAICQRDCCTVYSFLSKQKPHIFELLQDFFENSIRSISFLPSCIDYKSFVFILYYSFFYLFFLRLCRFVCGQERKNLDN